MEVESSEKNGSSTFNKLLVLLGLTLLCMGVFSIIALYAASLIFHLPFMENPVLLANANPATVNALKFIQVIQALGIFIIPSIVYVRIFSGNVIESMHLAMKPRIILAVWCFLLVILAQPIINLLALLNAQIPVALWMVEAEREAEKITELFLNMPKFVDLPVNLLIIALIPAIGEEMFFRANLQPLAMRLTKNKHVGVWLTAIIFSAMHVQFLGFIPRMFMGLGLGYLYVWSNNLWVSTLAHFFNNAFAVVLAYLIQHNILSQDIDKIGGNKESYGLALAVSLPIFLLLRHLKKKFSVL